MGVNRDNHQSSFTSSSGFTLIELLVVVAIIGLLMAILLPVLQRVRKQARGVACQANLKQWATTLALYLEDNEGRFPRTGDYEGGLSVLRGLYIGYDADPNKLTRYHFVRTEGIARCPMATKTIGDRVLKTSTDGKFQVNSGGTFAAWEIVRPAPSFRMSYGLNRNLFSPVFEGPGSSTMDRAYTDVFSLRGRDKVPVLLDAGGPSVGLLSEGASPPKVEPVGSGGGACINRHNGTVNGLFLDWSVRKVGLKELWALKWHLQYNAAGPWTLAGGVTPDRWPPWMRGFKDY